MSIEALSTEPSDFGTVGAKTAVAGVPGVQNFSGEKGDYLELAHSDALALANGTIALSFVADDLSGTRALLTKDANGYGEGGHLAVYLQDGWLKVRVQSDEGSKYLQIKDTQIIAGDEHHISVSFGEDGLKLYLDGDLKAAEPTFKVGLDDNDEGLVVGAAGWYRSDTSNYINSYFDGEIKDVMIFDEQLEPSEMAELAEVVTGPAAVDPGVGTEADETLTGTDADDHLQGKGGDDTLEGGKGKDDLEGGYGNDLVQGGDDDDLLDGGHGEDELEGGKGNDILLSRSDAREPAITEIAGRDEGDEYNELDPVTGKLYPDQPIPGDDKMTGGEGGDIFRFNLLINAKREFIEKHTADDGTIMWHRVAGENTNLHDHWVDGIGNDVIMDFNRAEGDTIEIVGHTVELYKIEHKDGDGDGFVDHSVLYLRSNQGSGGGAHHLDELGTITVYGDLVTGQDISVDAAPALGIVDTIDELDEALAPQEIGEEAGDIVAPASTVAADFGTVDGVQAVGGIPGVQDFSGERGDHLELAHSDALALANGTIALSFTADDLSGTRALLTKDANGYGEGGHLAVYLQNGFLKVRVQSEDSTKYLQIKDTQIIAGDEHHISVSFGEDGLKLYLDGELKAAEPTFKVGLDDNDEGLVVGAAGWYRSDTSDYISSHFDGEIKDIMIFDQQLDPDQVQTLAEEVTGPAAVDPGVGTEADETLTGTDADDHLQGKGGDDTLEGGKGKDDLEGGYGNDRLEGGDDDDLLDGGHGEDELEGGKGNDILLSRSDAREPAITEIAGRDEGDEYNELDPVTGKLYPDQPIPGDDKMTGGEGGDIFRFNLLINAKREFIEKHTADDGTIMWHRVAGENTNLHDHWVDGIGNDVIMDFNRAEGDTIEIVGHTVELYKIEHKDGDGDGFVDHSVLYLRSNQGSGGGAHHLDELGTITVYGDLVTGQDISVDAAPALGIVDTIDELDEALAPQEIGEEAGDIVAPASSTPSDFGTVGAKTAVAGVPGVQNFSGEKGDYLELDHSDALALANGTIALSFTADAVNGYRALISKDASGYGDGGHLTAYIQDGVLRVKLQSEDGSKYTRITEVPIVAGEAHHLAMSFGEDGLKVYVDGELEAAEPTFKIGLEDNGESLLIGAAGWSRSDGNSNINSYFDGTISDVMIFDEQLEPSEMAELAEVVTGPAAVDPGVGTEADETLTGTDADDHLQGKGGDDTLEGGKGKDDLEGGYGNDRLEGGDDDDLLDGGHGEDELEGGKGNDILLSRSDAREPAITEIAGRDEGDEYNELDPVTGKLYPDQPIPGDDKMTGGEGGDIFRFNLLINAKREFIEKHTADDGTIMWHRVAGENTNLHDHWVDGIGNDVIMDFNRAEGDTIEIVGHTVELYKIEHKDGDGDGFVDHSVLYLRSNQGSGGGAHHLDELGTITVYGDLVTGQDISVDAAPALGIVDTIDELDEALAPQEIGEEAGDIVAPASTVAADFGTVDGVQAVGGIPGVQVFSGERGDHLELAHSDALALANGTIALSFTADDLSGTRALLTKDANGYGEGGHLAVYLQNGFLKVRVQSEDSTKYLQIKDTQIIAGDEHHISVSFGEDGLKLYLDGELKAAEPTFKVGLDDNDEGLVVGAAGWYRSDTSDYISSHFDGEIKDIMIFDQQLDPDQVQTLAEEVTGPAAVDPGVGTEADETLTGTDADDHLQGKGGDDTLEGGKGKDDLEGGYGNDLVQGGDDDDLLDGGHGEDELEGGKGNDILLSRSDAREPAITEIAGRDEGDEYNELDPATGKLYPDQPIPGDDKMTGGEGGDIFRFNLLINAKREFIEKHTADNGMIMWHKVAGENTNLHDHWVDGIGNDVIMDFNRAEGDTIEIVGHTVELYKIEHKDGDGDGFVDHSVLYLRSNQGSGGGAHHLDELGTITVYGDLVTGQDISVDAAPALGIVDTIDELDEALAPQDIGTDVGAIAPPPSSVPLDYGLVDGVRAVSGIPGVLDFSGERGDYLELAHSDAFALANGTIALSFVADDLSGTRALLTKDASGYGEGGHLAVYLQNGFLKVRVQSDEGSEYLKVTDTQIVAGEEHHISVSFGDDGLKLYLDGELKVEEPTFTTGLEENDEGLVVGAAGWYRSDTSDYINSYFDGQIKDIMIFDQQLSSDQVQTLAEDETSDPAPIASDFDLIDTSLIKKIGFQAIVDEEIDDVEPTVDEEEDVDVFIDIPFVEDLSLEIEADHGV